MGKLIYSITTSIDGYVADADGNFNWTKPSEEVHLYINNILRNVGTFLFGRKVYEVMAVWDTIHDSGSVATNQFADIWRSANKIVYSKHRKTINTENTTLEKTFDTEVIRQNITKSDKDYDIGGPHLAAEAIKTNIIDEYHQFITPYIIGNGINWLPPNIKLDLKLVDIHKFKHGTVHLQYNKK